MRGGVWFSLFAAFYKCGESKINAIIICMGQNSNCELCGIIVGPLNACKWVKFVVIGIGKFISK